MTSPILSLEGAALSNCAGAGNFLQSCFWGDFKVRGGWRAFSFRFDWAASGEAGGGRPLPLLALYRRLAPFFGFVYVPWGVELPPPYNAASVPASPVQAQALAELSARLRAFLPKDTVFIRFDLPWLSGDPAFPDARASPAYLGGAFIRAASTVQPPDTVIIDLGVSEEEMLRRMKNKWRYNIGLSEKKGVRVRCYSAGELAVPDKSGEGEDALDSYYRLYRETAERDGIGIHGLGYYRSLFEASASSMKGEAPEQDVDLRLYLASHEGEDIAGIVTLFRKSEAVYLYGASAGRKRNLMAPYALQWKAMRDAKDAGCLFYDLYGIPPRSSEEEPDHPMAGLYLFKTGFGGKIYHRPGCYDYACRPLLAALYRAAEKLRKKIRDRRKRRGRKG